MFWLVRRSAPIEWPDDERSLYAVFRRAAFRRYRPTLLEFWTQHGRLGAFSCIAANKLKAPALALLGFGLGNVGLAILLAGYFHWGIYGVAAAGAVTSLGRNGLFSPLYTASVVGQPWSGPLKSTVRALAACLLLAGTAALFSRLVPAGSWVKLGDAAAPVAIGYAGSARAPTCYLSASNVMLVSAVNFR